MTAPFWGRPAGRQPKIGPTRDCTCWRFHFNYNQPDKIVSWTMLASNVEFVCTVTNNSLKTATGNGGAGHVLPYGEQKVLLEPVFCKIFRNAWSMHCIAGGACRSAIQRRRVCWIIIVKAIQVMIMLFFLQKSSRFCNEPPKSRIARIFDIFMECSFQT